MSSEWIALWVTAVTDFIINSGTAVATAMVATGSTTMPSNAVIVLALIGGLVAAARTIQQALKMSPQTAAKLQA